MTDIQREDLLGSWLLVSFVRDIGGERSHPYGPDPSGVLHYSESGRMFAMLGRRDRAHFQSDAIWQASEAEWAKAAADFLSYSGIFSLDGNRVVHEVDFCQFPNWIGTRLVRYAAWGEGNGRERQLCLETEPVTTKSGRTYRSMLTWRRASEGEN